MEFFLVEPIESESSESTSSALALFFVFNEVLLSPDYWADL
jgi:hypothetical protein